MHSWLPFTTALVEKVTTEKKAACMLVITAEQHSTVLMPYFLKEVASSFTMHGCSENVKIFINQIMCDKKTNTRMNRCKLFLTINQPRPYTNS